MVSCKMDALGLRQLRAGLVRNLKLKQRAVCASLCEILAPLVLVSVLAVAHSMSEYDSYSAKLPGCNMQVFACAFVQIAEPAVLSKVATSDKSTTKIYTESVGAGSSIWAVSSSLTAAARDWRSLTCRKRANFSTRMSASMARGLPRRSRESSRTSRTRTGGTRRARTRPKWQSYCGRKPWRRRALMPCCSE